MIIRVAIPKLDADGNPVRSSNGGIAVEHRERVVPFEPDMSAYKTPNKVYCSCGCGPYAWGHDWDESLLCECGTSYWQHRNEPIVCPLDREKYIASKRRQFLIEERRKFLEELRDD